MSHGREHPDANLSSAGTAAAQTRSPRRTPRQLVFALHDVAPPFERTIRTQLEALDRIGVYRRALYVVPNWHGQYPIDAAPSLLALLRDEMARGSQIVLHGGEHRPQGPRDGSIIQRARAMLFARDTAEYLTLRPEPALLQLKSSMALFLASGLPPATTFCAPGWLLAADLVPVLRAAGIRHLASMFAIHDLASGSRIVLPAVGHMGAGPLQERGIAMLNDIIRRGWLFRTSRALLYVHPQSGTGPAAQRVLEGATQLIRQGWEPATFDELALHARPSTRGSQGDFAPRGRDAGKRARDRR